jgi:hypothetical protein
MKDEHFDTKLNYLIYMWRMGSIADSELLEELDKEIF